MPIYEYHCKECGKKFELIREMKKTDEVAPCTACQSLKTERVIAKFFSPNAMGGNGCSTCGGGSCSSCGH